MTPLAAEQIRRNLLRDGEWEVAAGHRREVTRRLVALGAPRKRLCVLGAGNANDLELPELTAVYQEVCLVDLDGDALARGVSRQFSAPPAGVLKQRIVLRGGIDLTGIGECLAARAAAADWRLPSQDDPLASAIDPDIHGLPGPFDVVASVGLLSQLIESVTATAPAEAAWRWPLLLAVRTGHLRLCARLLEPGGWGLLAADFVSSVTCPGLADVAEDDLPGLASRWAAAGNFFHGLNPLFLPNLFASDAVLRELTCDARPAGYWLWRQRARCYAVLGISFRRRVVYGAAASS